MEKMTTRLQNLPQLNETLEEPQPLYASIIRIQRVNKRKDKQVPLLKNFVNEVRTSKCR